MGDTLHDLTGKRFGHWTVLGRAPNRKRAVMWLCRCDCGNFISVQASNLKNGNVNSCGCLISRGEEEIRKLSERVKFGYKRSVEKGVVAGSNNIYGYRKNKGKLEIDPEQAEIIKTIL